MGEVNVFSFKVIVLFLVVLFCFFCSVYIWWLNVRGNSLRVCSELFPVCFPIVRECVSVLL